MTALLSFLLALGVLVVAHEFGHYLVARLCGVKVLRFSIGFGRMLLRHVSRRDGTEWTLAALPLGGYVKMLDERDSEAPIAPSELSRAFNRQNVWCRIAIVAAGPVANFLLAITLFAAVYAAGIDEPLATVAAPPVGTLAARAGFEGGETIVGISAGTGDSEMPVRSWNELRWKLLDAALDHRRLMVSARVSTRVSPRPGASQPADAERAVRVFRYTVDLNAVSDGELDGDDFMSRFGFVPGGGSLEVTGVEPGSAAQRAGLRRGDHLLALDGRRLDGAARFVTQIQDGMGRRLSLQSERSGRFLTLAVTPEAQRDPLTGRMVGRIGAALASVLPTVKVRYSPLESLRLGARKTWDISAYSLRMFGRMVTGQASIKNLSGPVTIADYAGRSARLGLSAFASFLALVSISLGVLNLLPIPVLDGGHLLYYAVEVMTGRAVSERWQAVLQRAGLICIVALSALALFNDLTRLIHF